MTVRDSAGTVIQFLYGEDGLDPTMASLLGKWNTRPTRLLLYNCLKYWCPMLQIHLISLLFCFPSTWCACMHAFSFVYANLPYLSINSKNKYWYFFPSGGKSNQMQFLARNHQAVSHKYSMHEGTYIHTWYNVHCKMRSSTYIIHYSKVMSWSVELKCWLCCEFLEYRSMLVSNT